jgi:sugar phosphate isomerase/epimerase
MNLTRRQCLKLGAGAAAAALVGARLPQAFAATGSKIPIGLQLYSIRKDAAKDLAGVLAAVAQMGYQGVEFAGYYGHKAEEIRQLLDKNHLVCCGTHTPYQAVQPKDFAATVEFNKVLGNKYIIVPGLPKENFASIKSLVDTAKFFTALAAKLKPMGMRVGYHAHGGDFKPVEGREPWDVLFSNAGPDVLMQMDIGNCIGGGGDPIAYLKKFPGRSATIHLKEHGGKPGAVVGEGDVNWKEVFQLCETTGKTEWYIVEQEAYASGGSPLDCVARCVKNLRKMGK